MRVLTLFFTLLVFMGTAYGQNQSEQTININASAQVLLPADQILFKINLNAQGDTPQEAYTLHKQREEALVQLLKKHEIEEKNINFEPISINKTYDNSYRNKREKKIQTQQSVVLSLSDFDIYETIQITLIENGFDEFSGQFQSSETKEGEDKALKKALETAREKAQLIAEQTGLTITGIKNIHYSYSHRPPRPVQELAAMKMSAPSNDLMEFKQTVRVSSNVSVIYNFEK